MPTTYAIPDGRTVMAATLWTGTGNVSATQNNSVNGVSFQPDFVWVKARSTVHYHALFDSVRGTGTNALASNTTDGQTGISAYANLTSFNTNGFSSGTTSATNILNDSGQTFVGWQWKAGGTAVSNTAGSITSSVSANTTAGFSVVTYTGTGANATVGHGLGVAPSMMIFKNRNTAGAGWVVWHTSFVTATTTDYLLLNSTGAKGSLGAASFWNGVSTSTVLNIGTDSWVNQSATPIVAYCFAAVAGYSAFGKYTGNGSADGPFIYTGFRPRWVMIKRTDANENWQMYDTSRNTSNVVGEYLLANSSGAGATITVLDFLSNGFKIRVDGTNPGVNTSGGTYVYACFAENPLKYANAR